MSFWNKQVKRIYQKAFRAYMKIEILFKLSFLKGNNIFVFGYPIHPNMGDQAQAYCLERWIKKNYKDYGIIPLNWNNSFPLALRLLRKHIGKNDIILGHSGYLFYDLHVELPVYCKVAELFPDYRFIIFPQTINISDKKILEKAQKALNKPNITLLCRDKISFEKAQKDFGQCKLLLYPDIVTSLIGTYTFSYARAGILFCMRNDLEAFYKPEEIAMLRRRLENDSIATSLTDTTITSSYLDMKNNREKILKTMFDKFAHYKVIVTDRYHGTIFSLIASTPVVVLSSADHKLSSGVGWFPEEFSDYVKYAKDMDEAYLLIKQILDKDYNYSLPDYFEKKYYSNLKATLHDVM